MAQHLVFEGPRAVSVAEYTAAEPGPQEVLIETLHSGISAGTELTLYRGSNPSGEKTWSREGRLFRTRPAGGGLYPVIGGFGYEEVGRVTRVGREVVAPRPGDVVYGAWGHRSAVVMDAARAASRILPPGLDAVCGIFAQIGAIGLNAILDAGLRITEQVVVFGQGVPGLIATRLAVLSGATVIAVDTRPERLAAARGLGAAHTLDPGTEDVGEAVHEITGGKGADCAIEFSGAYEALHEAIRSVRYNGHVVASGFYQGSGSPLRLGEEFHHNRVRLICSQIFDVHPSLSHRWDRLRLDHAVMDLQADGRLELPELISHRFTVSQAAEAFRLLDSGDEAVLQVVLDF